MGDVRIAGKITSGAVIWEPGEDKTKTYYIVTPTFLAKMFSLAIENQELRVEIKKLQAEK